MKKIFRFDQYVNESYKVNEGGGSGIHFTIDKVNVAAKYEVSASGIERKSQDITVADEFKGSGYDDGMSNVGTWMLKTTVADPTDEIIKKIPIESIESRYRDHFFDDIDLPEEKREGIKTIGDLFIALPELVIDLAIDLAFKNYEELHFPGYSRGRFKEGDIVIGNSDSTYDSGDYDTITVSASGDNDTYEIYLDDNVNEVISSVMPQMAATKTFVEFYNNVFMNHSENFDKFIESELKDNDVDEDTYDEEIQSYIDDNDLDVTLEEFKKDKDKYVNDNFIEYMKDQDSYHTSKWDMYQRDLQDTYGKDNPGGLEQE